MTTPSQTEQLLRPTNNNDGTRTAIVAATPRQVGQSMLWSLQLPDGLAQEGVSGRFFLARCGATTAAERAAMWTIYRRRPLYATFQHSLLEPQGVAQWDLVLPWRGEGGSEDPGYRWLAGLPVGAQVNLLGPFGQGFQLDATSRNLLLVADITTAPLLLGLGDQMLDRSGRVTLLLRFADPSTAGRDAVAAMIEQLPIAMEVRQAATDEQWQQQAAETMPWADQIAVALPLHELPGLRQTMNEHRFRITPGLAQVLVQADLFCGSGACLACVVPTHEGGYTRACVHGPVFDLLTL